MAGLIHHRKKFYLFLSIDLKLKSM